MPADRSLEAVLMSIAESLYWAMDEADHFRPTWRGEVSALASQMEGILDEALPHAS